MPTDIRSLSPKCCCHIREGLDVGCGFIYRVQLTTSGDNSRPHICRECDCVNAAVNYYSSEIDQSRHPIPLIQSLLLSFFDNKVANNGNRCKKKGRKRCIDILVSIVAIMEIVILYIELTSHPRGKNRPLTICSTCPTIPVVGQRAPCVLRQKF